MTRNKKYTQVTPEDVRELFNLMVEEYDIPDAEEADDDDFFLLSTEMTGLHGLTDILFDPMQRGTAEDLIFHHFNL
jgi:hypothetical protein